MKAHDISLQDEYLLTFKLVSNLYSYFVEGGQRLVAMAARQRGASVLASPLDFKIDVDLKAARAGLSPIDYSEWLRLGPDPEGFEHLPERMKIALGRTWHLGGLHKDGAYSSLFHNAEKSNARAARIEAAEQVEVNEYATQNDPVLNIDFFGDTLSQSDETPEKPAETKPTEEDEADWFLAVGQDFQSVPSTDDAAL